MIIFKGRALGGLWWKTFYSFQGFSKRSCVHRVIERADTSIPGISLLTLVCPEQSSLTTVSCFSPSLSFISLPPSLPFPSISPPLFPSSSLAPAPPSLPLSPPPSLSPTNELGRLLLIDSFHFHLHAWVLIDWAGLLNGLMRLPVTSQLDLSVTLSDGFQRLFRPPILTCNIGNIALSRCRWNLIEVVVLEWWCWGGGAVVLGSRSVSPYRHRPRVRNRSKTFLHKLSNRTPKWHLWRIPHLCILINDARCEGNVSCLRYCVHVLTMNQDLIRVDAE